MENSLIILVEKLLKKNKISFDKAELAFQIQSHPSYPSLHSITGVLDHFNIDNIAADVPVNKETLTQLPNCFIAQVKNDNGKDLVLVCREKLDYYIFNSSKKKQKILEEEFLKKFTGIIVAVEKAEDNIQLENKSNTLKTIGFSLSIILVCFFLYKNTNQLSTIFYFGLSILGIITSIAIIKQELGLKTSLGDAFCSGADEKKDCDAVLSSKGAEIFKGYKLSDLSILYFTGLSVLTFIQISNPVISFFISLVAIPATLYSIYYQYAVIKKWCLLCLSIVAILWVQALFPLISSISLKIFINNDFLVLGIVSLPVLLIWNYIKPLFTDIHNLKKDKIENVKFKRNYILFENLLNKSLLKDTNIINNNKEIIFGNTSSNLEIILITNPFCGHCKPVHKMIETILQRYNNEVKVVIRFNVNITNIESDVVKITSRLLEIYNTRETNTCLTAMRQIYEGESVVNWLKEWEECYEKEKYLQILEEEGVWCKENRINFTPEILINGQSFPKEYNRADLIYFIEDLYENCSELSRENTNNQFELSA